jgi:hypothetical protein
MHSCSWVYMIIHIMFICIYSDMCVKAHIHTHCYIQNINIRKYKCMNIYKNICIHKYIYVHVYMYTYIYINIHKYIYTSKYICKYIYIYIYIYINTHRYIQNNAFQFHQKDLKFLDFFSH